MKYNIGDRVRCITDNSFSFTKDKVYTIREDYPNEANTLWVRVIKDDCGLANGLTESGFKFVKFGRHHMPSELETWHSEFPILVPYIKEVMNEYRS